MINQLNVIVRIFVFNILIELCVMLLSTLYLNLTARIISCRLWFHLSTRLGIRSALPKVTPRSIDDVNCDNFEIESHRLLKDGHWYIA